MFNNRRTDMARMTSFNNHKDFSHNVRILGCAAHRLPKAMWLCQGMQSCHRQPSHVTTFNEVNLKLGRRVGHSLADLNRIALSSNNGGVTTCA
jgi:hypothetical protein